MLMAAGLCNMINFVVRISPRVLRPYPWLQLASTHGRLFVIYTLNMSLINTMACADMSIETLFEYPKPDSNITLWS